MGQKKEEMDDLTHEAEQTVTQAQKAAKEQAGNEWKEWVDEALVGGAGKTHRFAQEPKGWTPTVTVQDGKEAADPSSLCSHLEKTMGRHMEGQEHIG